tara:strand:- start:83 stop:286 length:204 start_codon:yes stop_codon:yes gene_type:complete
MDTLLILIFYLILGILLTNSVDRYLRKNWEWYRNVYETQSSPEYTIIGVIYFSFLTLIAFLAFKIFA